MTSPIQAEDRVPEGAHRHTRDLRVSGCEECAVHGLDHEVEQFVGVLGRAAVGGVLEVVVELDLGAFYVVAGAIVEFGPHRRGPHVYRENLRALRFPGYHAPTSLPDHPSP